MNRKRWRKSSIYILSFLLVMSILLITLNVGKKYRTKVVHSSSSANDLPTLSIVCSNGRLGNQMFTYATLFGVARFNGRQARDPLCNAKYLLPYFQLSVEVGEPQDAGNDILVLHPRDIKVPIDKDIFVAAGFYPTSFMFFNHAHDDVRQEFTFRPYLLEYANKILNTVRNNRTGATLVAVHVRRKEYHTHLCQFQAKFEANFEFYDKAMELFRSKYSNILFVVTSDDPKWAKANVRGVDVHHVGNLDRDSIYDLAVLARCNHTIYAYGTFGFWAAYLAGGEVVYLRDDLMPNSYKERYLPEWIGIAVNNTIHCDQNYI